MNTDNIKKLRDHIATLKEGEFDISVCCECFIGHAWNYKDYVCMYMFMGITTEEADELTMPPNYLTRTDITIPVACAVLDNLIATGKVDWDYAIANPANLERSV